MNELKPDDVMRACSCCLDAMCEVCPYQDVVGCHRQILRDAISLLREKDAVIADYIRQIAEMQSQIATQESELTELMKRKRIEVDKDAEIERLTKLIEKEEKCEYDLCGQIVDLEAEIERLRADNDMLKDQIVARDEIDKTVRSEAITEFAERLISKCDAPHWCVWLSEIEDLADELKGEADGNS